MSDIIAQVTQAIRAMPWDREPRNTHDDAEVIARTAIKAVLDYTDAKGYTRTWYAMLDVPEGDEA